MRLFAVIAALGAACSYNATFRDCEVTCGAQSACPSGFACGAGNLCRAAGATSSCGAVLDASPDSPMSSSDGSGSGSGSATSPIPGIYVTDFANSQVLVFAADAQGVDAPVHTIAGSNTKLDSPVGIAIDHAGNIVVANLGGGDALVFAPDADGDVAPLRVIDAFDTHGVFSVAVDASDGIFGAVAQPQVFHVPAGATTSDFNFEGAPANTDPYLAIDSDNDVIVGDSLEVETFAIASKTGTPIRSFSRLGSGNAVAVAAIPGAIAVAEDTGAIELYDASADGQSLAPTGKLAPASIIHAASQESLAVDLSQSSPVFYTACTQEERVFIVPTTGTGASLTAGTVRALDTGVGTEPAGIAVVP